MSARLGNIAIHRQSLSLNPAASVHTLCGRRSWRQESHSVFPDHRADDIQARFSASLSYRHFEAMPLADLVFRHIDAPSCDKPNRVDSCLHHSKLRGRDP